ncbi:MAG: hypothetical protein ACLR1Z_07890 [Eubacterium sp.]
MSDNDAYDFILLTVRENQLYEALAELKNNKSNTIVTMVNSLDSYKKWEDIVGIGRILPAFPGAGGSINDDGILDAALWITKQSVYNQFYSDLVTKVQHGIDVPGTTIHVFYATKMGRKYEKRYCTYFKNPDIRRHNMQHEELFCCHSAEWVEEVRKAVEGDR